MEVPGLADVWKVIKARDVTGRSRFCLYVCLFVCLSVRSSVSVLFTSVNGTQVKEVYRITAVAHAWLQAFDESIIISQVFVQRGRSLMSMIVLSCIYFDFYK